MKKNIVSLGLGLALLSASLVAAPTSLSVVRFDERRDVQLDFSLTSRVPGARMNAKVGYQEGQARIEIKYDKMKPAVLFGGDVTCYVVWAINRDGRAENLGELWVRPERDEDNLKFSTGLRSFALMVTAEPYYQVEKPSELVISYNTGRPRPPVQTDEIEFDGFVEAPQHGMERLDFVRYDGKTPLDILQAEKAYQIAGRLGADEYAPSIYREASISLQQANTMSRNNARRGAQEYARRSVASSNEAIKITLRNKEAERLEELIARRQSEMEALEAQATQAREQAEQARAQAAQAEARADEVERDARQALTRMETEKRQAESAVEAANRQLRQIEQDKQRISQERTRLESALLDMKNQQTELQGSLQNLGSEIDRLETEKARILEENQRIERAKREVEDRLQSALSLVAETRESARGTILSLPDILFDLNEATLKQEAKVVMAKLAGILLIMPDLGLSIEGHTDSTGSADYNLELSRKRASSVHDFLAQQGVSPERMRSFGYGLTRPIADNSTADGRRRNRRVEIVIAEGEVSEEGR